MKKLIKLQIRNVFHNKLFYICLGLIVLLSPVVGYVMSLALPKVVGKPAALPEIMSFLSGEVGIIGAIFIALFCCYDFNEGTTKNIIARGYSRFQLLVSKYIATLVGLLVMYIITIVVTFILFAKNGIGYESTMVLTLINSIIGIIAYTIFYATISFLLEKNGSAILACIFIPRVVSILLGIADTYTKKDISSYWLENISSRLKDNPTLGNLGLSILFYAIYIIVIIGIGTEILKKKEIK